MLNKNFRYVAIDFETTWLDVKKDEAIQIGLVEIDSKWKFLKEFKSYIKPQKDISELRDIVAYITKIDLEDIKSAPSVFDLQDQIFEFFGENVILVWQNIEFDLNFIKKYFPEIEYYDTIDTFSMAQNLVHFAPSYALDVLVEHLMSRKEFLSYFLEIHQGKKFDVSQAHDALYDAKNALALFAYILWDMTELVKKYPILTNFVEKNTWLYHKMLDLQGDRAWKKIWELELPALEKQLPKDVSIRSKMKLDIHDHETAKRYSVWNVEMSQLVQSIISWNKNVILSFSSIAKLNIVKNMLSEIGVKNIGFARWQFIINKTKFKNFLNKKTFGDSEMMFVFKYMSHVRYNISILDLNTKFDYKINYYIQDDGKDRNYPVVLTTHGWLYSILDTTDHIYRNYDVCFFDSETWYRWYNQYLSSPCDLYSILSQLDNFYYKYTLDNQESGKEALDTFARFFEVFMWVLFWETKKQFINVQNKYITINPMLDNLDFFETNRLLRQFWDHRALLEWTLDQKDFEKLWSKIEHMLKIFDGLVQVNQKMYGQSDFYFVYSESTQFTNWDEFMDVFATNHILFLSNFDTNYKKLIESSKIDYDLNFRKISNINSVVDELEGVYRDGQNKICFVISTVKSDSKELFEKLYSRWLDTKADLLVENITGSLWKNIFKAKSWWSKIIVWWYNFMMRLVSNKITIDICVDFNIKWKMSKYLLNDLQRYAQNSNR